MTGHRGDSSAYRGKDSVTRKTSAYNQHLVKAEKRKVGHRQGRIIDIDGFLVFPEEMKKIRRASK